jgi:hypothetical protein
MFNFDNISIKMLFSSEETKWSNLVNKTYCYYFFGSDVKLFRRWDFFFEKKCNTSTSVIEIEKPYKIKVQTSEIKYRLCGHIGVCVTDPHGYIMCGRT